MEDRERHTHFFTLNCCNLWDCVAYVLFYVRFKFLKWSKTPAWSSSFHWLHTNMVTNCDSDIQTCTWWLSSRLLDRHVILSPLIVQAELVWEWKRFWPCCARWVTQQAMISVCELALKIHLKSSLIRRISLLWSFWSTPRIIPRLQDCAVF